MTQIARKSFYFPFWIVQKFHAYYLNDKNEIKVNYFWPINLIYYVHSCVYL